MSSIAAAFVLSVGVSQRGFAADTAATTQSDAQGTNVEHFTHSYLFELLDSTGTMGNHPHQYDKRFTHAFKSLISPYAAGDKRFFLRITSGPTTDGTLISIEGDQYVAYQTCQAAQCNVLNLAVVYRLRDGRMTGRLWRNCSITLMGNPTVLEVEALQKEQIIVKNSSDCK
jgi:hypothetical protein